MHPSVYSRRGLVKTLGQLKSLSGDTQARHHYKSLDDRKCGTTNTYRMGCRCDECKSAMTAYRRHQYQAKKERQQRELSANP